MATTKLLDYSFARPAPADIKNQGFAGVLRYLSPNAGKNLTASERDGLRAEGLAIGLVWEWYAGRAKEGHDAGVQDGQAALAQANALGVPASVPLFFAVDYDAPESDQPALNAYFQGVASVIGLDRTGVYGGYYIVKRLFDAGLVKAGWQTYAWSGGQWDSRAQLRQTLNGQWSGQVDFDEDENGLAGLWAADNNNPPAPVPAPVQPSSGTHDYAIQSGDTFWGLEAKNGWTHGTLQNLNPNAVATALGIGQVIQVPGGGTPAPAPAANTSHYQIRANDTFWGLEAANGWSHGTLQGLNPGTVATHLTVGQVINIPGSGGSAPEQHTYGHYTVVKGDTYWGIGNAHGWSVATLEQLNPNYPANALPIGAVINTP